MKLKKSLKAVFIILIIYLIILKISFYKLTQIFTSILPPNLFIIFSIIMIIFICEFKHLKKPFLNISKKTWIYLLIIFFVGVVLRTLIIPHHFGMVIDEPININIATNILEKNNAVSCENSFQPESCSFSFQSVGWPFFLSIFFSAFGLKTVLTFYLNILIGSLTVIGIFLFAYVLFQNEKIALLSAFLLSIYRTHIIWSSSANAIIFGCFLLLITSTIFFIYLKEKRENILFLFLTMLLYLLFVRAEMIITLIPYGILFLFGKNKHVFNNKTLVYISIVLLLSILYLSHFSSLYYTHTTVLEPRTEFNFNSFLTFLRTELFNFFNNTYYNLSLLLLAVIGMFYCFKKYKKNFIFLISCFTLLFITYTSYQSTGRLRFFINIIVILIIFSSLGTFWVLEKTKQKKKYFTLTKVIIIIILIYISIIETNQLYINKSSIPNVLLLKIPTLINKNTKEECVIISEEPLLISSTNTFKTIPMIDFRKNENEILKNLKKEKCVLFFKEYYCEARKSCENIIKKYSGEIFLEYKNENEEYTFYKLNFQK